MWVIRDIKFTKVEKKSEKKTNVVWFKTVGIIRSVVPAISN